MNDADDDPGEVSDRERRGEHAEIVGLLMMLVIMTMFVLDAFGMVQVREIWIWPLLVIAAMFILGLRKPLKRM